MTRLLCLDFDGVIHSYESGWVYADFIPDPPVPGAFEFIYQALQHDFEVNIFSSRSHQDGGIRAMQIWMEYWCRRELDNTEPTWRATYVIDNLIWVPRCWPTYKPSAFLTIDDRGFTFTGKWPDVSELKRFKPWNK